MLEDSRGLALVGGDQVVARDNSSNQTVLVPGHTGQGDVGRGAAPTPVEPQRHVLELRALVLVNGPSVTCPDGEVHDAATGDVRVRVAVDGQALPRLGAHAQATRRSGVGLDRCHHAVDIVVLLVLIARQDNTQASIKRHGARQWSSVSTKTTSLIEVFLVVLVATGNLRQEPLLAVGEQDLHGERVDHGGRCFGARDERRLGVRAPKHGIDVSAGRFFVPAPFVPAPGFVLVAQATHKAQTFLSHRLVIAKKIAMVSSLREGTIE